MPQQTKIFRVFVSSTFTDMKQERGILQKDAFPRLEKFCEKNGAKFQAVDLRWGVNEESSLNQKTLQICFNEIARCQKISPKPNFLILLGDKYGWQPIPEIIPEDEMKAILPELIGNEKELIQKWYWRDENAIPPEYVLQPREDALKEYPVWEPIETEIRKILRSAVNKLNFTPEQRIKYFASATHQEIMRGALNTPADIESPEKHVFAFSRNIAGLPNDNSAAGYIDLIGDNPDAESKIKLDKLKTELEEKLGKDHFKQYSGFWEKGTLQIGEKELQHFNDEVYHKLEEIISEQLDSLVDKDEIVHEAKLHQDFKEKLTEHFQGRKNILKNIQDYLHNTDGEKVLTLIGDSGSGKSSVMAKAVLEAENSTKNAVIVYRFIGTTSRSSNIISLLQSVCGQIAKEYNTSVEELAGEGNNKTLYDINGISEVFKKCLALSTSEKPVFLFLDALDQLTDADNALSLYWLPTVLNKHTKVVVSALPELETQLKSNDIFHLPVLPMADAEQILKRWLASVNRQLTADQQQELLSKFKHTKLPIYLKLAFERAKHWYSFTTNYTIQESVDGIINNFIDLLEEEHSAKLVQDIICFMLCGRYKGLAENEILEVLIFNKDDKKAFIEMTHPDHQDELADITKIPIVFWSRLFLDLEPFLTERDADGVPIITFFHRQFNEMLGERYGLIENVKVG